MSHNTLLACAAILFSVLLINWRFSDQLNFDKAKNGHRQLSRRSPFFFLWRFLKTEPDTMSSAFLLTYFSSTARDLFSVCSLLRYLLFSARDPAVQFFATSSQYIRYINSFLINWNMTDNKLRGSKAASAQFLDARERRYRFFKNNIFLLPDPFKRYKKENKNWMGATTSRTFIKPLNSKMTSCLLCLNFRTNFAGHSKFPFAISRTLIEPLSFGLCSWCLNFIQPFPKFRDSKSYKNKFHSRLLENSTLIEPLSFGLCSWCLNFIKLRYLLFSALDQAVQFFATSFHYINSFLIHWNMNEDNKLRGSQAANAQFLNARERRYRFLNFIQPFPRFRESQSYKIKLHSRFLQNKHEHLTSKSISRRPISGDKFLSSSKLIIILFEISSSLEREYGMSNCLARRHFP